MKFEKLLQKVMTADGVDKNKIAELVYECFEKRCTDKEAFSELYDYVFGDTLCKDECEAWVEDMYSDHITSRGQKWTVNETDDIAKRLEINFEEYTRYEFWAMIHALFYDYSWINSILADPIILAKMADSKLKDPDAAKCYAKNYYFHVVKGM